MVLTMGEARSLSNQEARPSQSLPGRAAECPMVCGNPPLHGGRLPESAGLGRGRSASQARGGISTLVRAGSARHQEPLVLGGHERSRPASSDRRSQAVRPYDLGRPSSAGQGSNRSRRAQPERVGEVMSVRAPRGRQGRIAVASTPSGELSGVVSRPGARRSQGSTVTALATATSSSLSHNGRCA